MVSEVDWTNSVSTSPIEETHDESIWGVDATNSVATRRTGAIHADTTWKVDATNSVDNETTRNNGTTSRKTNLVSDLTSYFSRDFSRLIQLGSHFCPNEAPFDILRLSHHFFHFAADLVTLSYTKMAIFPTLLYTASLKRHPFLAEPPRIAHCRKYPPGGGHVVLSIRRPVAWWF